MGIYYTRPTFISFQEEKSKSFVMVAYCEKPVTLSKHSNEKLGREECHVGLFDVRHSRTACGLVFRVRLRCDAGFKYYRRTAKIAFCFFFLILVPQHTDSSSYLKI